MKIIAPFTAAVLVAASSAMAMDDAKPKVVAFNATVRVEVDAAGKPVKVEAPQDLPQGIRGFIEQRVASWQYTPAKENGVAASAVTFVKVGACAIPVPEGYRLGLDFKGNGPRLVAASDRLPAPPYPSEAIRSAVEGTFKVSYAIQPDGGTRLESIETLSGGKKYANSFRSTLTKWAEGLRYEPELVNGRPVTTTMSFPVQYMISKGGHGPEWLSKYKEELRARAISSEECMAASLAEGLMPIALDSPVKVTPAPAG